MSLSLSRRSMLAGFLSSLAAPAIVKADMLMPISVWRYGPRPTVLAPGILLCNGAEVERSMFPELFSMMGTKFGAGDGKYTFLIPSTPHSRFDESAKPMGLVVSGRANIKLGRIGQGFDLGSNCVNAEILSSVENGGKPIEWTPKARMLMQESGGSLEYVRPDMRPHELNAAEREVEWYISRFGKQSYHLDRDLLRSRIIEDHQMPSFTYAEKRSAIEGLIDRHLV